MENDTPSPVVAILNDAKAKAAALIKAKKAEIADIDRAIAALNGAPKIETTSNILSRVSQIRHSMPVGDAIVKAVEAGNKTPNDIFVYMGDELSIHTTIGSVRARLSPLKSEGRIAHDGSGWVPAAKEKPESDMLSGLTS
jgi:hypothetical protein